MREIKKRAKNLIDYLPVIALAILLVGCSAAYYYMLIYRIR